MHFRNLIIPNNFCILQQKEQSNSVLIYCLVSQKFVVQLCIQVNSDVTVCRTFGIGNPLVLEVLLHTDIQTFLTGTRSEKYIYVIIEEKHIHTFTKLKILVQETISYHIPKTDVFLTYFVFIKIMVMNC